MAGRQEVSRCEARVYNSLVKIFPEFTPPVHQPECDRLTALKGERVSFQVAYTINVPEGTKRGGRQVFARVEVESELAPYITVRNVGCSPNSYPAHAVYDDNYLRTEPGLYPDLLYDLRGGIVDFSPTYWKAIWVDVYPDAGAPAGTFAVAIRFRDVDTGELLCTARQDVAIYDVVLGEQTLIRTEWLHADCLADYYHVPVFSEEHWRILENFIRCANGHGVNMLLTPVFTPPLDTAVGKERTTVQLIDVHARDTKEGRIYTFGFEKLIRWIRLARACGIRYFEISHLFTQWGAAFAPKVVGTLNDSGETVRLFGWESPAVGGEYTRFLNIFLPELLKVLEEEGVRENSYFHISDEPGPEHQEAYRAARNSVADALKGQTIIDALSDVAFYEQGDVPLPVCATDHIHDFLDRGYTDVWAYYCGAQCRFVSNRYLAMPSARNRIYGLQLFKYDIKGCLHWGFNFYNAADSRFRVNPFADTAAGGSLPGGDSFLVYPGEDGRPLGSIRLMVFEEGMNDLRALNMLAARIGREKVIAMMEEDLPCEITFSQYPKSEYYLIHLRARINAALAGEIRD